MLITRPVLHDRRFAMGSDWEQHAEALETYATHLEGQVALLQSLLTAALEEPKAAPKPPATDFSSLMADFFGPRK